MELFTQLELLLQVTLGANILYLILSAVVTAAVLLLAGYILPGVHVTNFTNALLLAVVTGLIVFAIKFLLASIGLGSGAVGAIVGLAVTTIALLVADRALEGVRIDSWVWALITAILVAIAMWPLPGENVIG